MTDQPVDPNEKDQHSASPDDYPTKQHGDALEEVVTDRPEMHDEQ